MSDDEDPYAVSSDSEDEKPRKKIEIEGKVDLSSLKSALVEQKKEVEKDAAVQEELAAVKAKTAELSKMKKDFEQGTVKNEAEGEESETKKAEREEREKLTQIGKEKYSKFKDRFENQEAGQADNLEERLKTFELEMVGLDKESLKSAKERFEKGLDESGEQKEREKIEIQRSDADKKRILSTFNREMTADEAPQNCAICSKIVYPVERIFAIKQLYHKNCFNCSKCGKKLTGTNYNSHQGALLCKVHHLAIMHPEIALTMDPATTEEEEHGGAVEEPDEDFAVSSKPKQLAANVVRGGANASHEEELAAIKSLRDKKAEWASATEEKSVQKTANAAEEIGAGNVRANKEKILAGGANEEEEEEDTSEGRDPNIVRGTKKGKKEQVNLEHVGDLKKKWKTGDVETAEQKDAAAKEELEALRSGISVKERFQVNKEDSAFERSYDSSLLDTASAADARRSFVEGAAYGGKSVTKTASDLDELQFNKLTGFKDQFEKGPNESTDDLAKQAIDIAIDLANLKAAFLKPDEEMSPEERAALKKKEIEAEFIRYKLARKARKDGAEDGGEQTLGEDVGGIRSKFDGGDAFRKEAGEKALDVEIKMAGKAREKFKEIDAAGAAPLMPSTAKKAEPSKWDKKTDGPAPECINRREDNYDDEPEDEDAFDVKNLKNKFKQLAEGEASGNKKNAAQLAELEALKTGAKDIKNRFEQPEEDGERDEEKKRAMQEEFDRLRQEREEAKRRLEEELAAEDKQETEKETVAVAEAHASKMAQKWEKIQKKEAKKAEKGRMPTKAAQLISFGLSSAPRCPVCSQSVFVAEQLHCFGHPYHSRCFRCQDCRRPLRAASARKSPDGRTLFCELHAINAPRIFNRRHA